MTVEMRSILYPGDVGPDEVYSCGHSGDQCASWCLFDGRDSCDLGYSPAEEHQELIQDVWAPEAWSRRAEHLLNLPDSIMMRVFKEVLHTAQRSNFWIRSIADIGQLVNSETGRTTLGDFRLCSRACRDIARPAFYRRVHLTDRVMTDVESAREQNKSFVHTVLDDTEPTRIWPRVIAIGPFESGELPDIFSEPALLRFIEALENIETLQ